MPLPSGAPNAHTAAKLPDPHILDGLVRPHATGTFGHSFKTMGEVGWSTTCRD
jgi:hypothetical protein